MKTFYETYFEGKAGTKYRNSEKRFESYFIEFASGARLELMNKPNIVELPVDTNIQYKGLVHIAFGVGNKQSVDSLTYLLRNDGYFIAGEPRTTGDGYYESIIIDPEGNIIEITDK
jgi:lactoylglutathione lyase